MYFSRGGRAELTSVGTRSWPQMLSRRIPAFRPVRRRSPMRRWSAGWPHRTLLVPFWSFVDDCRPAARAARTGSGDRSGGSGHVESHGVDPRSSNAAWARCTGGDRCLAQQPGLVHSTNLDDLGMIVGCVPDGARALDPTDFRTAAPSWLGPTLNWTGAGRPPRGRCFVVARYTTCLSPSPN